ncbi:MAG: 8-oxo-dGTP pyrophosphatase MutT, family [Streptosporangiaceae bacterium]|jgi:8-oxo-dGTP pyrophosphatase MutT (NUDIX family)|nr:8-oxo-dGTP pyrophosphatase MutT, family [Streptosporangiaceae bacterium]
MREPAGLGYAPAPMAVGLEFAQKAFITHGRHLLLVRKSGSDPHHPGRWEVPGGRLQANGDIDLDDHIRREVWEEVGIKVDPGPPFHLWQWYMPEWDQPGHLQTRVVAVARACRPVSLDITTMNQVAGDHLSEAAWVPRGAVQDYDLIPGLRPVMRHFLSLPAECD